MIEEGARVVSVAPGLAWVETSRRSACGSCHSSEGCGISAVSKLFPARTNRLQVADAIGVSVGDLVVIGIAEDALTRASLLAYLLPLATLILGAGGAELAGAGEGAGALLGILGLFLGIWIAGRSSGGAPGTGGYRPLLLRRADAPAVVALPPVSGDPGGRP
jgi:sigma-E factor negative regulatory protein RseC